MSPEPVACLPVQALYHSTVLTLGSEPWAFSATCTWQQSLLGQAGHAPWRSREQGGGEQGGTRALNDFLDSARERNLRENGGQPESHGDGGQERDPQ